MHSCADRSRPEKQRDNYDTARWRYAHCSDEELAEADRLDEESHERDVDGALKKLGTIEAALREYRDIQAIHEQTGQGVSSLHGFWGRDIQQKGGEFMTPLTMTVTDRLE